MYRYHCLNPISQVGLKEFNQEYEKTEGAAEADAILVRSADMHQMELPQQVSAVARAGAGVNNIPLEELAKKGVVVFNTPGANANGVKEMVLAGMLLASRDIVGGIEWLKSQEPADDLAKKAEKEKKKFAGCEISGKKLGIIGLGAIGVKVANAAVHLGMEVYGYDPFISVDAAWSLSRNIHHINEVSEIYRDCDYITIHVPLLESTKKMIGREEIAQMKDGVVLLNFARDLLVDEEAVLDGLASGKLRRYVSDFPNPTTAGKEGVILIPHLGASTEEAEDNCAVMAVQEISDYMENGNIAHSVNYPDCNMGVCQAAARIAVLHHNNKGVIAKYSTILGDADINVSDMTNKSRGDYAYALLDLDAPVTADVVEKLSAIEDVIKVRVIK